MEALFLKVLNMSLAASGLILGVMVLRAILKRAPRWMLCGLWALVALRLLCPFTLESALSLVPREEPIARETIERGDLGEASRPPQSPELGEGQLLPQGSPQGSLAETRTWSAYAADVWLLGAGAMTLYALVSWLRLRRRVGPSLAERDGVWICDGIDAPFVLGVLRPRIYLPSTLEGQQKAHVLAHERAHLRRRDNWWKPLGFLTLAVHWFDPLCWLAYVLFCRDMELAADELVVRDMEKADRVAYSKTLLACSTPRVGTPCPLAFGEVGIRQRISGILRYKKPGVLLVAVTAASALVLTACFMTSRGAPEEDFSIEGHRWTFALVQDRDGRVLYRPADSPHPEGEELDLELRVKNNTITLSSGEESWKIPYASLGEKSDPGRRIYVLNGSDPASGQGDLGVVSRVSYADSSTGYTLILTVEGWSLQFQAEDGRTAGEQTENVNGQSFFDAKVLRADDRSFLVEPFPGRESQTAEEILISREVLSGQPVPEAEAGDVLRIVYDGRILETYPAQLGTVFAIYPLSQVEGGGPAAAQPTVVRTYGGDGAEPIYEELSDGTWRWDGYIYRYRLVLTGRMPNAKKDSTFVVLSNREDITFQEAFMACGISSSLDDYFDPEDARIVQWK